MIHCTSADSCFWHNISCRYSLAGVTHHYFMAYLQFIDMSCLTGHYTLDFSARLYQSNRNDNVSTQCLCVSTQFAYRHCRLRIATLPVTAAGWSVSLSACESVAKMIRLSSSKDQNVPPRLASPLLLHYIFDLERSKIWASDAKIAKMSKPFLVVFLGLWSKAVLILGHISYLNPERLLRGRLREDVKTPTESAMPTY